VVVQGHLQGLIRQGLFSIMPQIMFVPIVGYPLPPAGHDVRAASDEVSKAL